MSEEIWTITKTGVLKPADGVNLVSWRREQFESEENVTWKFGSFEGARYAFRGILAGFAETESTIFDAQGNIRELRDHIERHRRRYDEFGPAIVERNVWKMSKGAPDFSHRLMAGDFDAARMVPAMLRAWLQDMGAFKRNPLPTFKWTDWTFGIVSTPEVLALGCTCGVERIEMYDSQVYTNAFDMSDPDGDYEFSVRDFFDVYDEEPARSLRLRLAKGPARKGGHFTWPEEDPDDNYLFDDGPSPCLQGMIDDSDSLYVVVHPEEGIGESELLVEYGRFVDNVLENAEKRGFIVGARRRSSAGQGLVSDRADLYHAEGDGAWSCMRFTASLEPRPHGREESQVRIGTTHFAGYGDALGCACHRMDEHLKQMGSRRWHLTLQEG